MPNTPLFMHGDGILFLYLGAVGAIFLLNAVQWSFYRDWLNGLFTLQTSIWFTYSLSQRAFLSESELTTEEFMAFHLLAHSLVQIIYLELTYRLFNLDQVLPSILRWFRLSQLIITIYCVTEILLLVGTNSAWQKQPLNHHIATVYWILLMGNCLMGIWVSAKGKGFTGILFGLASFLLMLHEGNLVLYYLGIHYTKPNEASVNLSKQILGGGLILELICFTLCILVRQRQIAVEKAISQTRLEEQLVQDRLKAELSVQQLEQEKTEVQLRAMQAQVNPHFLFNSLNSLSSLIDENPPQAIQFVDQLSLVYRYLLKANEQPITTLANELGFIQSYFHLLQTRFGRGISLSLQIDSAYEQQLLPTLSLQLLIENAVKHNVILSQQPLHIKIFTDNTGRLTVQNNLQRKRSSVLSNGVGLSTIWTHYQKLNQFPPEISEDNDVFKVILPLIDSTTKSI